MEYARSVLRKEMFVPAQKTFLFRKLAQKSLQAALQESVEFRGTHRILILHQALRDGPFQSDPWKLKQIYYTEWKKVSMGGQWKMNFSKNCPLLRPYVGRGRHSEGHEEYAGRAAETEKRQEGPNPATLPGTTACALRCRWHDGKRTGGQHKQL
jgi:hypothetical protein